MDLGRTEAQPALFCAVFNLCEAAEREKVQQTQRLGILSLAVVRDNSNSLLSPTRGSIVRLEARYSSPLTLSDSGLQFSKVLGDGPKQSGGRRRDVLSQGLVPTDVQEIAADLLRQSAIAYARPAGSPPRRLEVSLRRRGGVVVAPTRAPAGS